MQYCLWDHLKQLDSMDLRRSRNLAELTGMLISLHTISLSVIKVIDFVDIHKLTAKVLLHFRIMFEYILLNTKTEEDLWKVFTRVASAQELAGLRDGLQLFLKQRIKGESELLVKRCKLASKALANVANSPYGSQK